MSDPDALLLCQHIREHCQRQRWYAGDLDNTARWTERGERYETLFGPDGNKQLIDRDPDDHPRKTSFAYPPATAEQIRSTEQALGFALPPVLKAIYSQVANGGFGPGHGLIGAVEGFCEAGDLVENYQFYVRRARLIALEESEPQGQGWELPETTWPRLLLPLCDWDWAAVSCLDCQTEKVYLCLPGSHAGYYHLELQAPSLESWLEQWLHGALHYEPPPLEEPPLTPDDLRLVYESGSVEAEEDSGSESFLTLDDLRLIYESESAETEKDPGSGSFL